MGNETTTDTAEMPARSAFDHLKVDGRSRHARMVKYCAQALYSGLLAGITHFTSSDLKDVED